MSAHCQQLENDDRQPERVVVRRSDNGSEVETLKLWGRVLRDADPAEVPLVAVNDLEAVRIDERDCSLLRYQHAGMIDVANHATRLVY